MSIRTAVLKLINPLVSLFILFTVLPVKLNYSSIAIIVLTGLACINLFYFKKEDFHKNKFNVLIVSIPFLIYIIGLLNTSNIDYGLRFLTKNLSFLTMPLIFLSLGSIINRQQALKTFLFGLALTNIYLVYLFFYYYNFGGRFYMIVTTDLYHSTYLGLYNLFAFWICNAIYLEKKNKNYAILGAFFIISSILVSARIVFILAVVSIIISLFLVLKSKKLQVITIIATILCSLILFYKVPSIKQKFAQFQELKELKFDPNNYQSISSRIGKIEATFKLINRNPWFGVGTGDLQDELDSEYRDMDFLMGYKYRYNPHNQFLDSIARNGIVGGIITLIVLFIIPLFLGIRHNSIMLIAFTLVTAGVCLTESILVVHKGITFYIFFLSFFIYKVFNDDNQTNAILT